MEPKRSYFSLNVSFSDLRQETFHGGNFSLQHSVLQQHTPYLKERAAECGGSCLPSQPSGC